MSTSKPPQTPGSQPQKRPGAARTESRSSRHRESRSTAKSSEEGEQGAPPDILSALDQTAEVLAEIQHDLGVNLAKFAEILRRRGIGDTVPVPASLRRMRPEDAGFALTCQFFTGPREGLGAEQAFEIDVTVPLQGLFRIGHSHEAWGRQQAVFQQLVVQPFMDNVMALLEERARGGTAPQVSDPVDPALEIEAPEAEPNPYPDAEDSGEAPAGFVPSD